MELTKEVKIALIKQELAKHTQAIFSLTIQGRCAGILGNAKGVENIQKALEENTKAAAFYNDELAAIEKE